MKRAKRGERLPTVVDEDAVTLAYRGLDNTVRKTMIVCSLKPFDLTASRARFELTLRPKETVNLDVSIQCVESATVPTLAVSYEHGFAEACREPKMGILRRKEERPMIAWVCFRRLLNHSAFVFSLFPFRSGDHDDLNRARWRRWLVITGAVLGTALLISSPLARSILARSRQHRSGTLRVGVNSRSGFYYCPEPNSTDAFTHVHTCQSRMQFSPAISPRQAGPAADRMTYRLRDDLGRKAENTGLQSVFAA